MAALDDAYANGAYIADADAYPPRWAEAAAAFREKLTADGRAELACPYGPGTRQAFDLFRPNGPAKGVSVFVHGGYWLRFDRSFWSHFARGILTRGWACAMPSYDLCPDVAIAEITRQVATAVTRVADQIDGPITLAGHSAGGHLVSRMLAPGMLHDSVAARIVHVAPISPVADLRPLLQTSMNADFRMDMAAAEAESPVLQSAPDTSVSVWVGADERPAFLDQAGWLAKAWNVPNHVIPDTHHFDVIDLLLSANSDLVRALTPEGSA